MLVDLITVHTVLIRCAADVFTNLHILFHIGTSQIAIWMHVYIM